MSRRTLSALAAVSLLAGCEGVSTGPAALVAGEIELNASATNQYTYFSFATGQAVPVASPTTSSEWDLAVRRYEVRLNGGVLGPKGLSGANLANNAAATAAQVLAFTPANQKPAFDAVTLATIPANASFIQESLAANPLGWLSFGAQGPVANSTAAWKVRRASGGGFAVVRATGLTLGGTSQQNATLKTITVEWRYQPVGGTLGVKQTATLDVAAGAGAINLATGAVGAATGCSWDLQAAASFSVSPNVTCSGGTFPLSVAESFDGLVSAGDALQYGAFLAGLSGAVPFTAALDNPAGPFLYNLANDQRLSPTYNIYLIKAGTAIYKVQLIGYYNATGASGYPTIRYAQLQ